MVSCSSAGQPIDAQRQERPADTAHRVAILAQDKPLYRDFTVTDMLEFGQRTNRVWNQPRALTWLDRFDIPLDRRCGRLSGGQRAQVALAVALGARPGLLLLDEPLANLDPVARTEVTGELLAEVAETGMTVMLSTHIVAELAGVGEHLLLLSAGRPVLTGDVDDLLAGHARLTGPRADLPPSPGQIISGPAHRTAVHVHRHTPRRATARGRRARLAQRTPVPGGPRAHLSQNQRANRAGRKRRPPHEHPHRPGPDHYSGGRRRAQPRGAG